MSGQRLEGKLASERQRHFVGRAAETHIFGDLIADEEQSSKFLYLYGPPGIGKTTLIHHFVDQCRQEQLAVFLIDARLLEATPQAFLQALGQATGIAETAEPTAVLAELPNRYVLLIDTYENLAPIDSWLRAILLPQLRADTVVVLAGRGEPMSTWRGDASWRGLFRPVPLRNLNPEECRQYLEIRSIPQDQQLAVAAFTHGHPLALSLIADLFTQNPEMLFSTQTAQNVIQMLVSEFVEGTLDSGQRAALELCAMLRATTQSALREILDVPDAYSLFAWLQSLSFVEKGTSGLFPHDLAREALSADLQWRDPGRYAELLKSSRLHYEKRLMQNRERDKQGVIADYIYLTRGNPLVSPFVEFDTLSEVYADLFRESDRQALLAMISAFEGAESAQLCDYWLGCSPHKTHVVRSGTGVGPHLTPCGFWCLIRIDQATQAEREMDPAVAAACEYLERHGPLRPGESATLFRFWMSRDNYQGVCSVQSLILVNMVRHCLLTPGLAVSFMPCSDSQFWAPVAEFAELNRMQEADFHVDGRKYGVYGRDWRTLSPIEWINALGDKMEMDPEALPARRQDSAIVLSRNDFGLAVRNVLRFWMNPTELRSNPLLQSRFIIEISGSESRIEQRIAVLQKVMLQAAESLGSAPRRAQLFDVLRRTYFEAAPSQEAIAEALNIPFSTYRRHLIAAIGVVSDVLWDKEIDAVWPQKPAEIAK